MQENNNTSIQNKNKKIVTVIIICMVALLILCAVLIAIIESVQNGDGERETFPPLDPLKLHDTKEEGFDIMEYEEYLMYDRNVYLLDKRTNEERSVEYTDAHLYGKGFELLYDVINSIIEGDCDTYNSYMGKKSLRKDDFTQQQLYDIKIAIQSEGKENGADTYVFKVAYKIHENNGTYRDTIESDASRAQYFVIDNSQGELRVVDIYETGFKK